MTSWREIPPEAIWCQPCRLTLRELAPAVWVGGQSGDMVSPDCIVTSWAAPLGHQHWIIKNLLTREHPWTQLWKTTEASEEACLPASVHKALLPLFQHGAASATPPHWPGRSPPRQDRTTLTPLATGKDNLGEQCLYSPLPCPAVCPYGNFLTSKKINAQKIFPIGSPQLLEVQQMCLGCFTSLSCHMCWVYFFLTHKQTTW